MLLNMRVPNTIFQRQEKQFIPNRIYYRSNMENLLEKVTLFLSYSDDKLEELKQKNQALHLEESDIERQQ